MPLLHDCLNAYLSPLLKKHSFGGVLTYDDLATSLEQAKAILGTPPNPIVMKRLQQLHNSQLKAYVETAKKALQEFSSTVDIPSVQQGETQTTYVTRCLNVANERPNWKLSESLLEECVKNVIKKRALDQFQKWQQQQQQEKQTIEGQTQSQTQPNKTTDTAAAAAAAHNRSISNQSKMSAKANDDEEEGEIEEDGNNEGGEEGEDGEMVEDDEAEAGDEDEDGEIAEEEDADVPASNEYLQSTTTGGVNTNVNKTGQTKKRKAKQQLGGNTVKKKVVKKKTTPKKGAATGNKAGTKKVLVRKKGAAGKKRTVNNNNGN